jgi:hypothetical protein
MGGIQLQVGDWVRTLSGKIGKITLLSHMSAWVDIVENANRRSVRHYLGELTKIDPPGSEKNTPSTHQ